MKSSKKSGISRYTTLTLSAAACIRWNSAFTWRGSGKELVKKRDQEREGNEMRSVKIKQTLEFTFFVDDEVTEEAVSYTHLNWMLCIRFLLAFIIMVIVYFKYM